LKIFPDIKVCGKLPGENDLIIVVDTSEAKRTGFSRQLVGRKKNQNLVVIDHHPKSDLDKLTNLYLHEERANSCTEIVYGVLRTIGLAVTPNIATALLLGLFTDTRGFQNYISPTSGFNLASTLVRRGANLNVITQLHLATLSKPQKKLWGKALSGITINRFGLAVTRISAADMENSQAQQEDLFGLANIVALASEARASLVMVENRTTWRGILRTRSHTINVGRLAKFFDGKGSQKAAGFSVTKDIFSSKISE